MSVASITTILRYEKPRSAAGWLCDSFGFTVQHVEEDGEGGVSYISLTFGQSTVLVCPSDSALFEDLIVQPNEVGARSTQTSYLIVDDVGAHCATARKLGARIVLEPQSDGSGREFYVCRDLEGHLWSFGNRHYGAETSASAPPPRSDTTRLVRAASLFAVVAFAALAGAGSMILLAKEDTTRLVNWLDKTVSSEGAVGPGSRPPRSQPAQNPQSHEAPRSTELVKLRSELTQAREDLSQLRKTHAATTKALATARSTSERQATEKSSALTKLGLAEDRLRQERLAAERRYADAANALEAASHRFEAVKAQHDKLQAQLKVDQKTLKQSQARSEEFAAMVRALKQKYEADNTAKDEAHEKLASRLKRAQQDHEGSQRALQEARDTLRRTQAANVSLERRFADLTTQLSKARDGLKTVRSEQEKSVAELARVSAELRVFQDERANKRADADVAGRLASKERALFKAKINALNDKLKEVLSTLVHVRREKERADQSLGLTRRQAEQRLAEKEGRLTQLAAAYERVGQALKKERLTLDQIVRAFDVTKLQLANVQAAEKKLNTELRKTRTQLRNSRRDLRAKVAILHILDIEAAVQAAQQELDRKRSEPPPPLPTAKGKVPRAAVVRVARTPAKVPAAHDELTEHRMGTCTRAARRRLSNYLGWQSAKRTSAIELLCKGAETSAEPVKCFQKVIWGGVSWGRNGNRPWSVKYALNLCSGTVNSRLTLLCMRRRIRARVHWRSAIEECATNW